MLRYALVAASVLVGVTVAPAAAAPNRPVMLTDASFAGLTEITAGSNSDLTGIAATDVVISKPDGNTVPAGKITRVVGQPGRLTVDVAADQFPRITSTGTTIAVRAFHGLRASRAVTVQRTGEPASDGHILGSSQWTDNGWSTSFTDPTFYDPTTGQTGLY